MIPAFDFILAIVLPLLGWRLLASEDLFRAIVLFISFGLLMALTWMRLQAPDVALAEAAIGAALTGALFLSAFRRMERRVKGERRLDPEARGGEPNWVKKKKGRRLNSLAYAVALLLLAAFFFLLCQVLLSAPAESPGLTAAIDGLMAMSGVANRVTAVLMNFRGYDTLLELVVLLVAAIGVWSLRSVVPSTAGEEGPVPHTLVRLLAPLMVLISGYLVWQGASTAGGAFQAGAVLAGVGILLLLASSGRTGRLTEGRLRGVLVCGPVVFLFAAATALPDGGLLRYPRTGAGAWILLIETAAALSIGTILAALYAGGRPASTAAGPEKEEEESTAEAGEL
ncbi:MAG: hydrogenase subunit MbhD domain-containing protein [Thermodesulfobacteriota bacterium]